MTRAAIPSGGFFLGVDGGGTKTHFVCIDGRGHVVAESVGGTTYHLQVGLAAALRVLQEGVVAVCGTLANPPDVLQHVFFGLPGYGEDVAIDPQLHVACGEILGHGRYACGNDMVCGWAGSLGCADGINLVAGTGSIGYGERRGRAARIGGWGEVFGDEGSAYWIAIQGLNAFSRMSDGRLPRGPLYHHLRAALILQDDIDLCALVMGEPGLARDDIAALARIVSRAAQDGDDAASVILARAAQELAGMAIGLRKRLGFTADEMADLSWSGGVLTGESGILQIFCRLVGEAGGFSMVEPRHSPGYGAALYARRLAEAT